MQVWRHTVAQKKKLALLWPGLHWKTAEEVVQTSRCQKETGSESAVATTGCLISFNDEDTQL